MNTESDTAAAAQLFRVLGNESRLQLLLALGADSHSVTALTRATGMAQPLVSQHLRTLRSVGLVSATRQGKEVRYRVADAHVSHVIADALIHAQEDHPAAAGTPERTTT